MTTSKSVMVWISCLAGLCFGTESSPYLGQTPPGLTPEIFAPGVVSLPDRFDFSGGFTPDGNEFYFTYSYPIGPNWSGNQILVTRQENGIWTPPATVPFSGWDVDWSVFVSPDGQKLFFSSGRPNQSWRLDIWMCERQGAEWGDPVKLALNVSGISDYAGTCTLDGTLYFASNRDGSAGIYRSTPIDGDYSDAEKLPYPVNTGHEINPYIAPDESFLLFASDRSGNRDLYISYRNNDDTWTTPINLGAPINTNDWDGNPFLSPDGRYLFFDRDTGNQSSPRTIDIYWISTKAFLPDPNGPIENLTSGQRFASINCAINYAEPGDTLVLQPGVYVENISINKDLILQSIDPNDPVTIGSTIIQGESDSPVVTLAHNTEACELAGLTFREGAIGISGTVTNAMIRNCRIMDNITHGVELFDQSNPHLMHCLITANGESGIVMHLLEGRVPLPCKPIIEDCVIVQNGLVNVVGGEPIIIDSIISNTN